MAPRLQWVNVLNTPVWFSAESGLFLPGVTFMTAQERGNASETLQKQIMDGKQ